MAVQYWKDVQLYLGSFDATSRASAAAIDIQTQDLDVTTFGSQGWRERLGGLKEFTVGAEGFQDFSSSVDDALGLSSAGVYTLTAGSAFTISSAADANSTAYFGTVTEGEYTPVSAKVGDVSLWKANFWGVGSIYRGWLGWPKSTVTGTGGGTVQDLGDQSTKTIARMAVHVTAFSGFSQIVVRVESSTSGMQTWSNRCSLNVSGTSSSQVVTNSSISPPSNHTMWRMNVQAVTGTGSCTFGAAYALA